jgi:outer membrane lipoprotein SlyB
MKYYPNLRSASTLLAFAFLAACSPPQAATPPAAQLSQVCQSCGVVRSITLVTEPGQATGAGAVIGAVVGGVAGNQVGGGSGNKIATAAGVIGGALLGNNIEQNRNSSSSYNIVIDMESGGQQSILVLDPGSLSPGSIVTVNGNNISLY